MNRLLSHIGPPARALHAVLQNRLITRMQLAFLLFNVAEPSMWVAIEIYAFDQGGTRAVGFVSILLLVPAGLLAPIAAALGDRFRRERVVRLGYLAQGITTGATAAAMIADASPATVYALATIAAVTYTVGRPNHHALMPSLGDTPEEVAASNSVSSLVEGIGATAGGITAAVLAVVGTGAIYAVAAAAVLIGVVLTLGVHTQRFEEHPDGPFRPWSLATDAVRGLAVLARSRSPRLLVLIAAAAAVATGAIGVLTVPLVIDRLGLGDSGVGLVTTLVSIGLLVGAGVSVVFATRRALRWPMLAGAIAFATGCALFGVSETIALAAVAAIVYGGAITLLDVLGRTLLQRTTTDDVLTRVFGAVEAMWLLGYAAGAAIAPALESTVGLSWALVLGGLVVLAAGLASIGGLRAIDASAILPERQLALLRGIPMFAPVLSVDLERLARQMDRIAVAAGTDVIRQGDVGDRFYVVDQGSFAVLVDGQQVNRLEEGAFFGEIALLYDVPRTATVRALVDGAVWTLDREEFLTTITGLPQSESAAHAISAERLRSAGG
jgi:MFS family permease